MLRKTMIVLATAAALTGGLTADALRAAGWWNVVGASGGHGGGFGEATLAASAAAASVASAAAISVASAAAISVASAAATWAASAALTSVASAAALA